MLSRLSALALLPLAVSAVPTNSLNVAELFCKVNVVVISALQKETSATSYCSSYLSIPTSTLTATATQTPASVYTTVPLTVTGNATTSTITSTIVASTDVTTTETVTETSTVTTTTTTSTSTITCLNSAYTASPIVGTVLKRGNSVAKPTCIPTTWASALVSSACSCLSIPTPSTTKTITQTLATGTITVTSTNTLTPTVTSVATTTSTSTNSWTETVTSTTTTTLTAYAEATTIASNGIAYRKYTHSYNANLANSGFTSTAFKSLTPDFSGALKSLTFSTPNWSGGSTYLTLSDRSSSFESSQAALLLQGFFIAKETGVYTLSSSANYIDNWGYLWTGDNAYSSWNDGNTAFQASRTGAGYYGGSTVVTMNAGDAIPLTWLWANGGGVAQSYFAVTTPSGSITTDSTGYFVQACSASVFP